MRFVTQSIVALMVMTLTGCVCSTSALVSDGCGVASPGCGVTAGYAPGMVGPGCNPQSCDIAMNHGFSSGVCFGSTLGGGVKSILALPLGAASFVGGTVQSFFGCVFNCSHGCAAQSVCNTDPCGACGGAYGTACDACGGGYNEAAIPVAPPTIPPPAYYEPGPVMQQSFSAPAACPPATMQQFSAPVAPAMPAAPMMQTPIIQSPVTVPATPTQPPTVPVPQDLSKSGAKQTSWRFAETPQAVSAF